MDTILKLKHWQVFIGLMIFLFLSLAAAENSFSIGNISSIEFRVIFGITGLIIFFLWVMLIGLSLNRINGNPYHFNNILFILAVLFCVLGYGEMHLEGLNSENLTISTTTSTILSLLAFWGIIYTFKSVSKSLKSVEAGTKAKFKEYIIDAILILAFPIGVWLIQPRLNRIYEMKTNNPKTTNDIL